MSARTVLQTSQPPRRRCVICRESDPKPSLLRMVRRPDGEIVVSNRDAGRGAYVHPNAPCLSRAVAQSKHIAHALRRPLPDGLLDQLGRLAGAQSV